MTYSRTTRSRRRRRDGRAGVAASHPVRKTDGTGCHGRAFVRRRGKGVVPRFVSRFLSRQIRDARNRWRQGLLGGRAWLTLPITAISMYVLWHWAFGLGHAFGVSFLIAACLAIVRGHIFTHPLRLVLGGRWRGHRHPRHTGPERRRMAGVPPRRHGGGHDPGGRRRALVAVEEAAGDWDGEWSASDHSTGDAGHAVGSLPSRGSHPAVCAVDRVDQPAVPLPHCPGGMKAQETW